jgi:hypothetical protein
MDQRNTRQNGNGEQERVPPVSVQSALKGADYPPS